MILCQNIFALYYVEVSIAKQSDDKLKENIDKLDDKA